MYKACKSYAEQSECVASLGKKCQSVLAQLGKSDGDTRRVALSNLCTVAQGGQMVLIFLDSWSKDDEAIRNSLPQSVGSTTVTPAAVQAAGEVLSHSAKRSFAVLGHFQIENCLSNIARELHLPSGGTGFYKTAKAVTQALSCPPDKLAVLNVAALIHYSLHSNGIHHGYQRSDTITPVKGVTYKFLHNQPVTCASWEHIAHALEGSVDVLEYLLETLAALPGPIKDSYVWVANA